MNFHGRVLAQASLAAAISLGAVAAQAQSYPTRNITMIVPFAAGGPTDVVARIVTGQMAPGLGQSIIIENVVGAGGTTGAARAARAANDGYTLITGHMGTHAASVPLYPKLAYHPEKDFEPIALLAGTPILILARKDFPPPMPASARCRMFPANCSIRSSESSRSACPSMAPDLR
jgi:tripartite-type tricarboxylate transporter receptor subunit TctC